MNRFSTAKICRAGIIASVYFVLTYFLQAISFGPLQARVAEVLTVLPLFFAESVPALFIGCFLANFFSGFLVFDLTLGSLATLISAILTRFIAKIIKNKHLKFFLGAFPPAPKFTVAELHDMSLIDTVDCPLPKEKIITGSDAHRLEDISEAKWYLELEGEDIVAALFEFLR